MERPCTCSAREPGDMCTCPDCCGVRTRSGRQLRESTGMWIVKGRIRIPLTGYTVELFKYEEPGDE